MQNTLLPKESTQDDLLTCTVCRAKLVDAVLLKCLHSACRLCSGSDKTASVTCSVCQVSTETWAVKTNLLISSLLQRSPVSHDDIFCTRCIKLENQYVAAVAKCFTCQHSLCEDCQKCCSQLHSKHTVIRLKDQTNVSAECPSPPRLCTTHNEELRFACFSCKDGRCPQCVHDCYTSAHEVLPLDRPEALKQKDQWVAEISQLLSCLNLSVTILDSNSTLPQKVHRAQEESLAKLKKAKKTALQSISDAYEDAAKSLSECWDTLAKKCLDFAESAERLKARVDWTNKYCQLVLNSNDLVALLPQLDAVFSSVRESLEETRQYKEPVDPSQLVRCKVWLPSDLDSIARGWFELAKVVSDDFNSPIKDLPTDESTDYYTRKVSTLKELEELLKTQKQRMQLNRIELQTMEKLLSEEKKNQMIVTTQNDVKKLLDQQKQLQQQLERERRAVERLLSELRSKTLQLDLLILAAPTKPLSWDGRTCGPFNGPGSCWDVTVTPNGRLLVAATADGLKEYDATSFREIASWKPDADLLGKNNYLYVRTVDALSDGRALVGLNPNLIVLLRHEAVISPGGSNSDAEAWGVERLVAELQAPPRRLSAWDDRLLAVLEDRYDERTQSWCCGPGLVLLSLSDGDKQLHRQQLDYNACSIALTDRGILVASSDEVELADAVGEGRGNRKCYVVDCYNHMGVRLWRHVLDDGHKVISVCSDSVGRVMYAAKCRGPVVAFSIDDGLELRAAIRLTTMATESSHAIAIDKKTQCRQVLITRDGFDRPNRITVFTVC